MATEAAPVTIRSTIPARLDRLSWSPFHTRMVAGLGAAWILDGLQITIASSVTGVLIQPDTLDMTSTEIGLIASVYLIGKVVFREEVGRFRDQSRGEVARVDHETDHFCRHAGDRRGRDLRGTDGRL